MREIVHLQAGQCGNQIGGKVSLQYYLILETISKVDRIQNGETTLSFLVHCKQAIRMTIIAAHNDCNNMTN